jgi:hypothetical protein
MEAYKIGAPALPLQSCLPCKEGHMYKTVDEASAHLKRVHFRGKDELDLSQLAHLKRTHRYVPNLL